MVAACGRSRTRKAAQSSRSGFALTAYPVGVERGWVTREQAAERTLTTLRFVWTAPQGEAPAGVAEAKLS